MNCRDIENILPAYLEDLLPPEERKKIREHLASCRQCSKALADLKQMETILSDLEAVSPPPWMKQRIMARVREEAQPEKGFFRRLFSPHFLKIPLSTAALLLISVLAFYVYRGQEPELHKEGIHIALSPPVAEQRIEKQGPSRTAPVPLSSSPNTSSRPVLLREIPSSGKSVPGAASPPASAQPADQAISAQERDLSSGAEGIGTMEKGKRALGNADSSRPQEAIPAKAPFPVPGRNGAAAFREEEKAPERAAPQPPPSVTRTFRMAERTAGSKERKAESVATKAQDQESCRNLQASAIVNLLLEFDAVKINYQTSEGSEILTAELPSRQVRPLLQKLEARGIAGKNVSVSGAETEQEMRKIRIEIPGQP
ncbi:Predicted integral membrane protein [Syntrophus gentianae]|uniref:Predicted integral membrane protein n=1 Tax=Syntrophus gentianae TaxID=43775 RepID=A0A1H8AFH9_9BACT|nr:zf-HC2 domain-containing protein [Syntrophus gentianae]SEM69361.1 Predicted integral membrane protein [Syntrophus gentianae]